MNPRAPPGLVGFPSETQVRLRYVEKVSPASGAGALSDYVFSLNNVYDPNVTGTGHQPLGFDQWATFYANYVVTKATVKITPFVNTASTAAVWGMLATEKSTLSGTTFSAMIEQGISSYQLIINLGTVSPIKRSPPLTVNMRSFFNVDNVRDNPNIGALTTASPSEQCYLHIWHQDLGLAAAITVSYIVEIDYDVIFSQPKELAQS